MGLRFINWALVLILLGLVVLAFIVPVKAQAQDIALGDSIALGTGHALGVKTYAWTGASSCTILAYMPQGRFDHVVISAGINDPPGYCVEAIFDRIVARRVVVILPAEINSARARVAVQAARHGYATVSYACAGGCTKRNFHPGSYAAVARAVRSLWGTN